jgi:diguanylate cyclase (GGDEF)-like protein/PAS domain S-box-containing protein
MRSSDQAVPHATAPRAVDPKGLAQEYAALVESTDGSIITSSLDGTILTWDLAAERIFGFSAGEAVGQPLSLIVPVERAGETMTALRSAESGGVAEPFETVRLRHDHTSIDVSLTVSCLRDTNGRIIGAMSVARDISASKVAEQLLSRTEAALSDANRFLDKAEELSRTGTWILSFGAEPSMICSPESYRLLGLDSDTPMTVDLFFSFVHPDDREHVGAAMGVALAKNGPYDVEYRMVCPDSVIRWVHAWGEPEYDEHGEPLRVLGVVQDITERHTADETLRASERRFRLLAENARDLIFRIALLPTPHFEYVSPAVFAFTGFTADEMYEQPALAMTLVTRDHVKGMAGLFAAGALSEPIDIEIRRKDGSTVWASQQLTLIHDDTGALTAVEGIDRDITERKRSEDERAYANRHDGLTGLPNRLYVRELLEVSRDRARTEGNTAFVVSLDLDDFTLINDTRGYKAGDAALVAVAGLLTATATEAMSVGRTGGDEFTVVGNDINGAEVAAELVERVRRELRRPVRCDGVELVLQARFGVAVDDLCEPSETLLRDAQIALARAKRHRTETGVELFDAAMRTGARERLLLVNDLYGALDRRELELRYQPIVSLADDRIIGAEALIRWRHPERGLINPAEFIPLAEDTGLIVNIGAWVLSEACAQLRSWSDADPRFEALGVSVNLSVKQLRSSDIVNTVRTAISDAGIDPGRLTIEMTESVFADDLATIHDLLQALRAMGVRTAIDDFGTGYSSLAYLKHLPIDTLKIDKAFVDGLGTDPRDDAIIASTLSVSTALHLLTVAEGVETMDQFAKLRDMGCDAAQGFYMSPPVKSAAFESIVMNQSVAQ